MISLVTDVVASLLLLSGGFVVAVAGFGLYRLPDPLSRMHAVTKSGAVGASLILLGAAFALGGIGVWATALAGILFLLGTIPLASHALGRASYISGAPVAVDREDDALMGVVERKTFDVKADTGQRR